MKKTKNTDQQTDSVEENGRVQLAAIASGDEKAMQSFFHQYSNDVYRYLMSRCKDEVIASDVLNDVMMNVWRQSARFEGRSRISTWLISVARNKLVDYYRKERRHTHDELDESIPDDVAVNEQEISAVQQSELLKSCIDKLVDIQREIVHLTFYSDLAYHDVAEIIQCPVGTVKSRMYHAREALRKCLLRDNTDKESMHVFN